MDNLKLIIFDLDGTLVDAYRAITRSFNFTMRALKLPAQDSGVIRRAVGGGDANLLKPFVPEKSLAHALAIYRAHHAKALERYVRFLPHVKRTLAYLKKQGYLLAIASNRPTRFSRIIVRHLGLRDYIGFMLCADKLAHGKPHPEILRAIMRRYALSPSRTMYVGDMAIDAQAGRRAGVRTVVVTTGSGTRQEIVKEKPFRIIDSLSALAGIC